MAASEPQDTVDADAEASYLIGLEEVEALLADDVNDVEALAVKSELESGLAALRGKDVHKLVEVIGPALPSQAAAGEDKLVRPSKRPRTSAVAAGTVPHIHPGTGYADQEPDFAQLASDDAELAPFVHITPSGSAKVDFKDSAASKAVTSALLRRHYGVHWTLPSGQLIPPVPGRANYVAWIADLLALSKPQGAVVGLDIGCGANLIYPLLGSAQHGWSFVAADNTDAAIEGARANVLLNSHLRHLIEVRDVREAANLSSPHSKLPTSALLPPKLDILGSSQFPRGILRPAIRAKESFAFCMCNPPFFEGLHQAGLNPNTAHEGTAEEMVCPGGEAAFVGCMIADSLELRLQIHWFTSMVGRKSSLKALRSALYRHKPTAIRTTEFVQGKTSRWGLAWSFAASPLTNSQPLIRQAQPPQLAVLREHVVSQTMHPNS